MLCLPTSFQNNATHKFEITFSDDVAKKLEHVASKLNLSPEEFAANSLLETLERHADFQNVTKRVLDKNAELYKRLA